MPDPNCVFQLRARDTSGSWRYFGQLDVNNKLLTSYTAGDRSYQKIHLDDYDQSPVIPGKGKSNRKVFFYFTDATLHGVRLGDWNFLFK